MTSHLSFSVCPASLGTGLRSGELIGLRWGDVDLTTAPAVLSVQRSSYRGKDGPTKSAAGIREVLLIDRVVEVLQRYQEQCFGATLPIDWRKHLLFQTAPGTKLDPDDIRETMPGSVPGTPRCG
jgi:integrase